MYTSITSDDGPVKRDARGYLVKCVLHVFIDSWIFRISSQVAGSDHGVIVHLVEDQSQALLT